MVIKLLARRSKGTRTILHGVVASNFRKYLINYSVGGLEDSMGAGGAGRMISTKEIQHYRSYPHSLLGSRIYPHP